MPVHRSARFEDLPGARPGSDPGTETAVACSVPEGHSSEWSRHVVNRHWGWGLGEEGARAFRRRPRRGAAGITARDGWQAGPAQRGDSGSDAQHGGPDRSRGGGTGAMSGRAGRRGRAGAADGTGRDGHGPGDASARVGPGREAGAVSPGPQRVRGLFLGALR